MEAPAQDLMCVTNSLTGSKLDKPFLLPGSIWQLKCFVARQHDHTKMRDVNRAIKVLKLAKSSSDCEAVIAGDVHETVDAVNFKYMFTLCTDDFFKPCRDMTLVHRYWSSDSNRGESHERYTAKKDVLDNLLGWWRFHELVFAYYENSEPARHHRLRAVRTESRTLEMCSGRDQVVTIFAYEDAENYHFNIQAYGDWQDVIQDSHKESRPPISWSQMQEAIRQRQAARAAIRADPAGSCTGGGVKTFQFDARMRSVRASVEHTTRANVRFFPDPNYWRNLVRNLQL